MLAGVGITDEPGPQGYLTTTSLAQEASDLTASIQRFDRCLWAAGTALALVRGNAARGAPSMLWLLLAWGFNR